MILFWKCWYSRRCGEAQILTGVSVNCWFIYVLFITSASPLLFFSFDPLVTSVSLCASQSNSAFFSSFFRDGRDGEGLRTGGWSAESISVPHPGVWWGRLIALCWKFSSLLCSSATLPFSKPQCCSANGRLSGGTRQMAFSGWRCITPCVLVAHLIHICIRESYCLF